MKTVIEFRRKHLDGKVAEGLLEGFGFAIRDDKKHPDLGEWLLHLDNLPKSIKLFNIELFDTDREASDHVQVDRIHYTYPVPESTFKIPKQYATRDIIELDKKGGYYCRHVQAMTEEGLHSKSDIAAELAWRDEQIARLQKCLSEVMDVATGETQIGDENAEDDEQIALEYIAEVINEAGYEQWRIETDEEEV